MCCKSGNYILLKFGICVKINYFVIMLMLFKVNCFNYNAMVFIYNFIRFCNNCENNSKC